MKLKLTILVLSILTLVMLTGVNAQETNTTQQCSSINPDILITNITDFKFTNGSLTEIKTHQFNILCDNGCDTVTQKCSPDDFELNLMFLGLFVGFIILFVFLATKLRS